MTRRLEAIVLAGGSGSRFGGAKLTAPWRGGFLIDGALAAAFASPARTVTVATGADGDVERVAAAFAEPRGQTPRLRLIYAPEHAQGLSATLRAAIAALPADASGAYLFLGDMPDVPASVLAPLAQALEAGALAAAPVCGGRRGHPVLFCAALFPLLAGLTGDEGAREVLKGLGDRLALVPTDDPGVLTDIDTPQELKDREG
ncbi:MAG TPA: nucleotidyltransferase family protein [Caulobacteraceae bacterium]|nr:nucleotidyltransferase family protein [Caulobacteraceae bacterium]